MASKIGISCAIVAILLFSVGTFFLFQDVSIEVRHKRWCVEHNKVYKDEVERVRRLKIFKKNVDYIEASNKAGKPFKLGLNEFADLTNDEISAQINGPNAFKVMRSNSFKYENVTVPCWVDWREEGAVTPVKNQGPTCGACWAFSAVGSIEGFHKLRTGSLVSLSEQQLIDCSRNDFDRGCHGGYPDDAFSYVIQNGGLTSDADYPYKKVNESCDGKKETNHVAIIHDFEGVPVNDEEALLKAVANQPISAGIAGRDPDFVFYKSGVFDGSCGIDMNHAVTIVGYGVSDDGIMYWLIKNSWGPKWGEDGYMRLRRNVEFIEGMCGIAMRASYPTS